MRLIQVRDKALQSNQRKQFAHAVMALAREHNNCCVLVNDDATLARDIGARTACTFVQTTDGNDRAANVCACRCHMPCSRGAL